MSWTSTLVVTSVASAALAGVALGAYVASHPCVLSRRGLACVFCGKRKRTLPKRIILVRHGQSEGNIDPLLYCHVPDNAMHLTDLGFEQAIAAGKSIKQLVGNESVRFIVSPYVRTIETFEGIAKAWGPEARDLPWSEEPRIREQDFGNFQEPVKIRECKEQRKLFGSFFYRFPSGESPADVYDRVSSFLESLYRMFEKTSEDNYILVTHGVAIRVILTRYFKYRICEFEQLENFHNGEYVVLERLGGDSKYNLSTVIHNHVEITTDSSGIRHVQVETEEANALRVRSCTREALSGLTIPYPSSPVHHFRRVPSPPSPMTQLPPPSQALMSPSCSTISLESSSCEPESKTVINLQQEMEEVPLILA